MRTKPRSGRGFTLAEVMVAAGILVAGAAVLSRLLSIGTESADFSQRLAEGTILAENRFAEFDAGLAVPSGASGQSDAAFPNWQFDVETETVSDFLLRVTVTAEYAGPMSGPVARVVLTRLFYDAVAAADAADQAAAAASSAAGGS